MKKHRKSKRSKVALPGACRVRPERGGRRGLGQVPDKRERPVILIVCAHPDDAELGAGGMIAFYSKLGYRVVVVFLTRGSKGGPARVRAMESVRACRLLGVRRADIHFGPFHDTRIPNDYRDIGYLEKFSNRLKPVLVATHSEHDKHQDHVAVAQASLTAFRRVPRLLSFEAPSATAEFMPTCFVDITEETELKARALACHVSQIKKCMSLEYDAMTHLAAFRGQQAGVLRAEAFEVHRFLVPHNLL